MDIDLEGQFPLFITDLVDALEACLMCGVVDENVDTAELLDRRLDDLSAVGGILDVTADEDSLASGLLDQPFRLIGILILVEIGEQQIGTLPGIGDRHCPANAAIAAGDDRPLALQPLGTAIALFAMVGNRVHLCRETRHRLLLGRERRCGIIWHRDLLSFRDQTRPDACCSKSRGGMTFSSNRSR
ncbi:hypothetical protein ACQY74_007095 (plasmid) [Rhizobium leguminosarum bv. trifolii]